MNVAVVGVIPIALFGGSWIKLVEEIMIDPRFNTRFFLTIRMYDKSENIHKRKYSVLHCDVFKTDS